MNARTSSFLPVRTWEKIVAGLLTVIIAMLSYYITRITIIQDRQDKLIQSNSQDISNIANILDDDPDTSPENSCELRKIYFVTRGPTTQTLTPQ